MVVPKLWASRADLTFATGMPNRYQLFSTTNAITHLEYARKHNTRYRQIGVDSQTFFGQQHTEPIGRKCAHNSRYIGDWASDND